MATTTVALSKWIQISSKDFQHPDTRFTFAAFIRNLILNEDCYWTFNLSKDEPQPEPKAEPSHECLAANLEDIHT
jgi:hypothetical protein